MSSTDMSLGPPHGTAHKLPCKRSPYMVGT